MVRIFVGFDDTDVVGADRGTGKLARWFQSELPTGCRSLGVLRQQLLVDVCIPYTSHNSAACVVVEAPDASFSSVLFELGVAHVHKHFIEGSDPGLCVVPEEAAYMGALQQFGLRATREVLAQRDAFVAVQGGLLRALGGNGDGVIGAAAAVGLTASGWHGRFIALGDLRSLPGTLSVGELEDMGILVCDCGRDARHPSRCEMVCSERWLRPRLLGGRAVLLVREEEEGRLVPLVSGERPVSIDPDVVK